MPQTLFTKGLVVLAVPTAAQVVFLGLAFRIQQNHAEAQRWANHTKDVIARAQQVQADVAEVQAGVRGFAATGDASFATPFDNAVRDLPAHLDELHELVGDNPGQAARVATLRAKLNHLLALQTAVVNQLRAGERESALKQIRTRQGLDREEAVRAEMNAFLAEEDRLDGARTAALADSRSSVFAFLAAGCAVSLLAAAGLAVVFRRGISERFAALAENTRRLAAGRELGPPLRGSDEIARLDRAFRGMAAELTRASGLVRRVNEELERRVKDRTAELAEANRSLTERNEENELFVYSVSHDLRSPLVNLQGFSQELGATCRDLRTLVADGRVPADLRDRAADLLDRDAAESLHFIQAGVMRLSGIIDALLRLSRAGRVEYRAGRVDLGAVAARVVDSLHGTIAEKGAEVAVGDLPPVWADPAALEQVLANLLGNALTYLDPARPGRIEVGADPSPEGGVTIRVRDNGRGIPAAYQAKVFQAFQRVHPDAAPGEGMGLAIVRRVVERHRGRVWVESEAGAGSTFHVFLPGPRAGSEVPGERGASAPRAGAISGG